MNFTALKIPTGNTFLTIAASTVRLHGISADTALPDGWQGIRCEDENSAEAVIQYQSQNEPGFHPLQLFENTSYRFLIDSPAEIKTSGIECREDPDAPDSTRYFFTISNYLGTAWIQVGEHQPVRFDVISKKLNYHSEYRTIVESIASECNELLLDWNTPTSLPFAPEPEKEKQLLLEQFLFLRHVLSAERLDLYLETLRRNPHTALAKEENWQPHGTTPPAPEFFQDPMKYGRHWASASGTGGAVAQEVMSRRKYETLDTPANRFVKFALETFRDICDRVIENKNIAANQGTAWREAGEMRNALDAFLVDPFFADVKRLTTMPGNNQTLMKREGYRQILHAWLMLDAAAQLDWPGREDAYDGTKRDVPTLYEFWLYFVLREMLQTAENLYEITVLQNHDNTETIKPFLVRDKHGLRMNLKRGQTSVSAFRWCADDNVNLRIHFYFDRVFERQSDVLARGTYSRAFRPDYTLVVFPDSGEEQNEISLNALQNAEKQAEKNGQTAYLHFDAKYRVEKLTDFFGSDNDADSTADDEAMNNVDVEKQEAKQVNTYRRGDLYKMHTYNEAIRRTVGSYVLYPGTDEDSLKDENRFFRRYHEVLPGVGAFVLRPVASDGSRRFGAAGSEPLLEFIRNVLHIQHNRFSQLYRLNYWTHDTVKEASPFTEQATVPSRGNHSIIGTNAKEKPAADTKVLLGYIRPEAEEICRYRQIFYYHAIENNGEAASVEPGVFDSDYFCPYTKSGQLCGWFAKIISTTLIKREELAEKLDTSKTGIPRSNCPYYFLVSLTAPSDLPEDFHNQTIDISSRSRAPVVKKWSELFPVDD